MRGIIQYLNREGYSVPDAGFYSYIRLWMKWYRGKTSFHSYAVYNGAKRITKSRKTLGMAKRVPEDWANLLLNEKVEIVIDGEAQQKAIDEVLRANNFRVRGNQLVELAFALGTGAFVELLDDNGEVDIDYIRASMIFPLTYKNGEITECAFASERKIGQGTFVYLNIAVVINPRYTERNDSFRFNETFQNGEFSVLFFIFVNYYFQGIQNFFYCLMKFRFSWILCHDSCINFFCIRHCKSSSYI